jgi:hypothetical protein
MLCKIGSFIEIFEKIAQLPRLSAKLKTILVSNETPHQGKGRNVWIIKLKNPSEKYYHSISVLGIPFM